MGLRRVTPARQPGSPYAVYRGIVSLYVPTGTTLVSAGGANRPPSITTEAGRNGS